MTITPKDADHLRALAEMAAKGHVITSGDVSRNDTQSTGWRPIETAPMDGTQILGYAPPLVMEGDGETFEAGPYHYICWWNNTDRWFETDECGALELSHWMPLPAPPSKGE